MLLSIIIPVFNVEKYVERCIVSCVNQCIPSCDYEIIAVNDGTKDRSADIVKQLIPQYTNLKLINQSNQGLSAARNKGMSIAQGDYIWFVDSDDWISTDCLKDIFYCIKKEKPDGIAICAANWIQGKAIRRNSFSEKNFKSGVEMLHRKKVQTCAPFTIWKRQFLINYQLKFMNGIFHEDTEFTYRAYYYANQISTIDKICYLVYQNPTSITRTFNPKRIHDIVSEVCRSLYSFSQEIEIEHRCIYYDLISMNLNTALSILNKPSEELIKSINELFYINRSLYSILLKSSKIKYKIEGVLFILFPKHAYEIYNLLQNINCSRIK